MRLFIYLSDLPGRPHFFQSGATGKQSGVREVMDLDDALSMTDEQWIGLLGEMRDMLVSVRAGRDPQPAPPREHLPTTPASHHPDAGLSMEKPEGAEEKAARERALAAALDRYAPRDDDKPLPLHPVTDPDDPDAWRADLDDDGLSF